MQFTNIPIVVYHPEYPPGSEGPFSDVFRKYEPQAWFSGQGQPKRLEVRLTEREELVLNAVITYYIQNQKPVGSRTLATTFPFQLSAASIRNVLSDLEDKGFVAAQHRSAGRVPTIQAYRHYVENLLELDDIGLEEKKRIQQEYLKHELKLDKILQVTSKILSLISTNASVVLGPGEDLSILKHVELISVTPLEILIILVTRSGMVFNKTVFTEKPVAQEELYKVSRFLNENLKGYDIRDIREEVMPRLRTMRTGIDAFPMVVEKFAEHLNSGVNEPHMYLEGYEKFNSMFLPEEEESLNALFNVFDAKTLLKELFSSSLHSDGINTIIMGEDSETLPGLSIITTHYRMGDKKVGAMGVMGPNRMDYSKVLPLVGFMSNLVSEMITKLSK